MKRCYVVVAMLSILALSAGTALAAVTNGPHDAGANAGAQGVCSPCHLPHTGSTAARLWPVAPTVALTPGTTPSLCASCHYATGAYSTVSNFADARSTSGNVFGTYSHGKKMLKINIPPGQNMANSGLPYAATADASIECTTCHNVHDDTNRPFIRANIDVLCAMCHNAASGTQGRQFASGALTTAVAAWGDNATYRGANNAGSHPVGTDITEAAADAEGLNPITFPAQFTAAKSAASTTQSVGNWSLGGHLISTTNPGVSCNTCHAVHGMARDAQDTVSGAYTAHETSPNMLVIDQTNSNYGAVSPPTTGFAAEATSGRTIASGHNTAGSGLCEGCHVGPTPTGYSLGRAVNPGGQLFTHPVDDYAATYEIVGAFPANWPYSSTTSGATGNAAICESCHTPHPAAWNPASPAEGRATILPTAGPYILRANTTNICGQCHNGTVAFARHHPIGRSVAAATGATGAAAYLKTGIATWSDTLSCATCHTGQSGGAHNWKGKSSVAMNPNWRPADNGRVYPDTISDQFNAVASATCIDCHLDLDGVAANLSPTMGSRTAGAAGTDATETEYTYLGTGSHFLGQFAPAFLNGSKLIRSGSSSINVWTSPWTTAIFGTGNAAGGWSRFGGTTSAPYLVCESCHELQPGKNISSHMLLSSFREGQSDNLAYAAAYDDLCEACHGKPAGTHPMTADNVGRTGTTLDTTINVATRPWLVTNAPKATPTGGAGGTSTWNTGGVGVAQMTCESCHQVHDANTQGASLIIEAPNANVTGGTPIAITATGYYGGGTISNRLREKTPSFGSGTPAAMPDVSMFCDQCHGYRAP